MYFIGINVRFMDTRFPVIAASMYVTCGSSSTPSCDSDTMDLFTVQSSGSGTSFASEDSPMRSDMSLCNSHNKIHF